MRGIGLVAAATAAAKVGNRSTQQHHRTLPGIGGKPVGVQPPHPTHFVTTTQLRRAQLTLSFPMCIPRFRSATRSPIGLSHSHVAAVSKQCPVTVQSCAACQRIECRVVRPLPPSLLCP